MKKPALKKYCLALDLVDDSKSIAAYKKYHENVWPEIEKSITDSGIKTAEIYCIGNRLFIILEVDNSFSFERKGKYGRSKSKGSRMGNTYVEISTGTTNCKRK